MAKESFQYPETAPIFKTLEEISQRSSVSRGRAFEDVIRASVAALAAETMEEEYFEAIKEHTGGTIGKRGVDLFGKFFGQTVEAISRYDHDVLGDMFQGAISYGENAFYMTPEPIASMMASVTMGESSPESELKNHRKREMIHDPCCGTGIMLIEAGRQNPEAELSGIDVDHRCADICAINLGLRSHYGWVICGNSLSREVQYVYRIGHFYHEGPKGLRRGVIRKVPNELCSILPELQSETKQDLLSTLKHEDQQTPSEQVILPNIIEVPRYLLHLEYHQLKARTDDESASDQYPQEEPEPQNVVTGSNSSTSSEKSADQVTSSISKDSAETDMKEEKPQSPPSSPRQKKLF